MATFPPAVKRERSITNESQVRYLMQTLVLLRHGESTWNRDNLFTGWFDADLSERGCEEARRAAALLAEHDVCPDAVHTSLLTRAIRSAEITLHALGRSWLPVRRSWRLNERHYGTLEGMNKKEASRLYGAEQVQRWRRSFDVAPPPLSVDDARRPRNDIRYRDLAVDALPDSESLENVVARVLPYWYDSVVADLAAGRVTLVVAHGNSLRALVMHLLAMATDEIAALNIATGQPWRFELDGDYQVVRHGYLDPEAAAEAAALVGRQAG